MAPISSRYTEVMHDHAGTPWHSMLSSKSKLNKPVSHYLDNCKLAGKKACCAPFTTMCRVSRPHSATHRRTKTKTRAFRFYPSCDRCLMLNGNDCPVTTVAVPWNQTQHTYLISPANHKWQHTWHDSQITFLLLGSCCAVLRAQARLVYLKGLKLYLFYRH